MRFDIFIDSLNEFNQIISNIDDTNDYLLIRKQILLNELKYNYKHFMESKYFIKQ